MGDNIEMRERGEDRERGDDETEGGEPTSSVVDSGVTESSLDDDVPSVDPTRERVIDGNDGSGDYTGDELSTVDSELKTLERKSDELDQTETETEAETKTRKKIDNIESGAKEMGDKDRITAGKDGEELKKLQTETETESDRSVSPNVDSGLGTSILPFPSKTYNVVEGRAFEDNDSVKWDSPDIITSQIFNVLALPSLLMGEGVGYVEIQKGGYGSVLVDVKGTAAEIRERFRSLWFGRDPADKERAVAKFKKEKRNRESKGGVRGSAHLRNLVEEREEIEDIILSSLPSSENLEVRKTKKQEAAGMDPLYYRTGTPEGKVRLEGGAALMEITGLYLTIRGNYENSKITPQEAVNSLRNVSARFLREGMGVDVSYVNGPKSELLLDSIMYRFVTRTNPNGKKVIHLKPTYVGRDIFVNSPSARGPLHLSNSKTNNLRAFSQSFSKLSEEAEDETIESERADSVSMYVPDTMSPKNRFTVGWGSDGPVAPVTGEVPPPPYDKLFLKKQRPVRGSRKLKSGVDEAEPEREGEEEGKEEEGKEDEDKSSWGELNSEDLRSLVGDLDRDAERDTRFLRDLKTGEVPEVSGESGYKEGTASVGSLQFFGGEPDKFNGFTDDENARALDVLSVPKSYDEKTWRRWGYTLRSEINTVEVDFGEVSDANRLQGMVEYLRTLKSTLEYQKVRQETAGYYAQTVGWIDDMTEYFDGGADSASRGVRAMRRVRTVFREALDRFKLYTGLVPEGIVKDTMEDVTGALESVDQVADRGVKALETVIDNAGDDEIKDESRKSKSYIVGIVITILSTLAGAAASIGSGIESLRSMKAKMSHYTLKLSKAIKRLSDSVRPWSDVAAGAISLVSSAVWGLSDLIMIIARNMWLLYVPLGLGVAFYYTSNHFRYDRRLKRLSDRRKKGEKKNK